MIQTEILDITLASIIIIFGLIALVLSLFRIKSKDNSLLSIGIFALLYGTRALFFIQSLQPAPDNQNITSLYIISFISYLIPIPFFVFIIQIFGKGRYNLVLWAIRTFIVFAVIGIISDILQGSASTLNSFSQILVLFWITVTVPNIFKPGELRSQERNGFFIGLIVFLLFVINANLTGLDIVPWQWNKEEFGFIFLLVCLGYIAAYRFFENEKKLFTVEQEMATAREIQSRILPQKMPSIAGLDMVELYIPMSAVAGDFYDFIVEDNRICILLADVSGHGVGAALIGSMLKIAFASQEKNISNPALVLHGINRTLHGRIEGNFVTACCIYIDTGERLLQYANAGHPPSLLYMRTDEEITELTSDGIIMGPFPDATYENKSVSFNPETRILLYTDGITETKNHSDEFFGDQRLKDFLKENVNLSPSQFVKKLIDHLYIWSGKPSIKSLDDDLTALVIDIGFKSRN